MLNALETAALDALSLLDDELADAVDTALTVAGVDVTPELLAVTDFDAALDAFDARWELPAAADVAACLAYLRPCLSVARCEELAAEAVATAA